MRKLLGVLLCAALLVSCIWMTASAETKRVDYVDAKGNPLTAESATVVNGSTTNKWSDAWYVVEGKGIGIAERIEINGDVNLILGDGCEVTANTGIFVPFGATFTIWGQSNNSGTLIAIGGYDQAGIGGENNRGSGSVTINGGIVEATGGSRAAGIGGGYNSYGSNITVNGGNVTAKGGTGGGAGIGGGEGYTQGNGYGRYIYINGGEVTAIGGGVYRANSAYCGAGIGGGYSSDGSDIVIRNGTVHATSGSCIFEGTAHFGEAGIGAGYGAGSKGERISIYNGKVTAIGGDYSAGIGGSSGNGIVTGSDISIYGGTVNATGGMQSSVIGGGPNSTATNITIEGGTVIANGGDYGAGIGGGDHGYGNDISISSNADVTANGGLDAAGIGGGRSERSFDETGNGSNISIFENAHVIAQGGTNGAGIGGGGRGIGSIITISDTAEVTAIGGSYGAGIGGSRLCNGSAITISAAQLSLLVVCKAQVLAVAIGAKETTLLFQTVQKLLLLAEQLPQVLAADLVVMAKQLPSPVTQMLPPMVGMVLWVLVVVVTVFMRTVLVVILPFLAA